MVLAYILIVKKCQKESRLVLKIFETCFISRSAKGIVNLWNLKTKRTELILDGHNGNGILAADFLPGGKVIRLVEGIKKSKKIGNFAFPFPTNTVTFHRSPLLGCFKSKTSAFWLKQFHTDFVKLPRI